MVEIAAKRIDVRRERVGIHEEGLRGVNDSPADVDEAMTRLREVEGRNKHYHHEETDDAGAGEAGVQIVSKQQRLENIRDGLAERKLFKEGRLVHRAEPELKTHTSYLVFAILPREWSEKEEARARESWPGKVDGRAEGRNAPLGKKARKLAAKAKAGGNKAVEEAREEAVEGANMEGEASTIMEQNAAETAIASRDEVDTRTS